MSLNECRYYRTSLCKRMHHNEFMIYNNAHDDYNVFLSNNIMEYNDISKYISTKKE